MLADKLSGRGLDVQEPILLVSDDNRHGATKEGIKQALAKIAVEATPDGVFFLNFFRAWLRRQGSAVLHLARQHSGKLPGCEQDAAGKGHQRG